jgi:DNA-directed RNA polymerase specialized sigma24 family protein
MMHINYFIYKDDAQLVAELLAGNEGALHYVFYDHFKPLLKMNAYKAAGTKLVTYDDLVQELYLYLSSNNWEKLRKYNPERPFVNWFSVVSYRFFKDFSRSMIDSSDQIPISNMNDHQTAFMSNGTIGTIMMDIKQAISKLKPPRDSQILEALLLRDEEPEIVAKRHNVTVDNLLLVSDKTFWIS